MKCGKGGVKYLHTVRKFCELGTARDKFPGFQT